MKAVLRTTDRALIETVRIELESEGIAVVLDQESGAALPFIPAAVLVSDSAFSRALEVVQELAPGAFPVTNDQTRSRRLWRGVLLALVILTIIAYGSIFIG